MKEIDAGVNLVAVDRYAFHVHAERDMACVRAVQDAAQIVATYLDGARERIGRPEIARSVSAGTFTPSQRRKASVFSARKARTSE